MGRPRKGEEKVRPKHIGFRAATWVWEGLQELAARQGQPASEVAHELMEIALGRFGIKPKPEPTTAAKAEGRSKKVKRPRKTAQS